MGWREYAPSPSHRIIGEGPQSLLSKREREGKTHTRRPVPRVADVDALSLSSTLSL